MAQKSIFGSTEFSKEIILDQNEANTLVALQALGSVNDVADLIDRKSDTIRYTLNRVARKLMLSNWQSLRFCRRQKVSKSGATRQVRGAAAAVDEIVQLIEKQSFRCALSGVTLSPEEASLDHIVPLSNGGTNEVSNLQWLHKDINHAKGKMTNEEFIAMCRKVVAWTS